MNAAVFLDRDNTIIHNDGDLGDPAQVKLIQGAASGIASLRGLGYKIVVVTNQGGVARGKFTESDVEAVHQRINELIQMMTGTTIDRFYYCPYHPDGILEKYRREHSWRKPQPGMLLQAARDLNLDLMQCWMVGDQMRDIEAGYAAGVRTILLRPDAEELTPLRLEEIFTKQTEIIYKRTGELGPYFTSKNLIEAVRIIAQQRRPETPEEFRAKERINKKFDQLPKPAVKDETSKSSEPEVVAPATAPVQPVQLPFQPPGPPPVISGPPKPAVRPVLSAPNPAIFDQSPEAAERAVILPRPVPLEPVRPEPARPDPTPVAPPRPAPVETPGPEPKAAPAPPPRPVLPVHAAVESPIPAKSETDTESSVEPEPQQFSDIHTTLKLLLQEFRNQRATNDSFSYPTMVAIILQMLAVFAVVMAIALGWSDGNTFFRCASIGLILQMATISTLLFKR